MAKSNLKSILINEGITQSELMSKCGVKSLNRFVNGNRTPSPTTANKIRNAFNAMPNISKQYELQELFPTLNEK
jgi:transcriptional regulator with XRE-family HTH domain